MAVISMRELLEAGVHFGHQSTRWNPKMGKFIYASRNNIHVIDLHKSIPLIEKAYKFIKDTVADNGTVLFVGTKKQAQEAVAEEAGRCGMYYVNERWMGGTLTNFKTLKKNIARMKEIEKMEAEGTFELLTKKEVSNLKREHKKLERGLGGIRSMTGLPAVIFVVDTSKEVIAVKEGRKLGIPVVGMVDTNADPDEVDYPIPSNDDAIRSVKLISSVIADAVLAGRQMLEPDQEALIPEELAKIEEMSLEEAEQLAEEERLRQLADTSILKEEEVAEEGKE